MATAFAPRTLVLFLGDILFFALALWGSLYLRSLELPSRHLFLTHLIPFSLLFVAWIGVFFIAGLYENRSLILARRALSSTLLIAQSVNIIIAALFFFLIPFFGITPKTLLLIYLAVSFLLILLWRAVLAPYLRVPEKAIVVGEGAQIDELVKALRAAHRAPAQIMAVIAPSSPNFKEEVHARLAEFKPRFVIGDWNDPRVNAAFPDLYNLLSAGIRFFDSSSLYEEVFGRVPLSLLTDRWVAANISQNSRAFYDPLKRFLDIAVAVVAGGLSLVLYPFIALCIKLEDGGPVFVSLERVGKGGKVVRMYKFRSMTGNDGGNYGASGVSKLSITKVGNILRKSRLDELPQFFNVLRGDLSLIGPRPEAPALVSLYEKEIPYYGLRHLIHPGLSGSAQLYHHQDAHHAADVASTREKLSYDLFYLKHRSLTLDLSIGLKTVRRLLVRGNS